MNKQREVNHPLNNRFQEGFEKGLSIIEASLSKKSGIKTEEKVYERVGRLKQKYPSVAKYWVNFIMPLLKSP